MRDNVKNGDTIQLSRAVQMNSIVFTMPRYNTGTTMNCSFSQIELFPGEDSYVIEAYDITTGKAPTYTNLSISYFVLPV